MKRYELLRSESLREFNEDVNLLLSDDGQDPWELYGPPIIVVIDGVRYYYQALVIEEE